MTLINSRAVDRHVQRLLKFPFGRDLTLFAQGGVEFRIHSIMLVGGPSYLEEQISVGLDHKIV